MPDLTAPQAALDADATYQQLVAAAKAAYAKGGPAKNPDAATALTKLRSYAYQFAKQKGLSLPDGYSIGADGKFTPDAQWDWSKAALTLIPLAVGGGVAALGLGGAGAAPAAAAHTLTGVGATGAGVANVAGGASTLSGLYAAAAPAASAAVAATKGAGAPAAATTSAGGKAVASLTGQPNIWSTIIGTVGNLFGAKNSSDAANDAAKMQSDAISHAADLQAKSAADSLAFQKSQWDTTQQNFAPWLKTGQSAITTLGGLLGLGGGDGGTARPVSAPRSPMPANGGRPAPTGPSTFSSIYGTPGAPDSQQAQPHKPASDYARITWPDGSQDTVQRGSLPQYQLLGAQENG